MSTAEMESTAPQASRWEDSIDVFFSPAELYRRRAHDRVAPALLTLIALGVIAYYVLLPANGIIMRAATPAEVAANPQAQGFMRMMLYFGGSTVGITHFVSVVIAAVLLWVVGRTVELKPSFRQGMIIATYAGFIYLLFRETTSSPESFGKLPR